MLKSLILQVALQALHCTEHCTVLSHTGVVPGLRLGV